MDTTSDADAIRAIERARLRSLVEVDLDGARRLHADDFQLVNPFGGTASKEEYLDDIASGETNYLTFEAASDIAVRVSGTAAAIRYRSHIHIIVGGREIPMNNYWHTDLYERRDEGWPIGRLAVTVSLMYLSRSYGHGYWPLPRLRRYEQ